MWEFVENCMAPINLPFSILLCIMILYWVLVVFGAMGLDLFDIDIDTDMDVDVDAEFGMDGGVGSDGQINPSLTIGILKFFHVGELPVMVLVSIFSYTMWLLFYLFNYYYNPQHEESLGLQALLPTILLSLLVLKIVTLPLAIVFEKFKDKDSARKKIVGQVCLITTSEVTEKFSQGEIQQDGPALVINVRVTKEHSSSLRRGDAARVMAYDRENNTYIVVPKSENN